MCKKIPIQAAGMSIFVSTMSALAVIGDPLEARAKYLETLESKIEFFTVTYSVKLNKSMLVFE